MLEGARTARTFRFVPAPPGSTPEGRTTVAAENRLTAEQLAGLVPGDTGCIEVSGEFRRPKLCAGTVVRIEGSPVVVSTRGA